MMLAEIEVENNAELEVDNNLTIRNFTFPYAKDPMQFQPKS